MPSEYIMYLSILLVGTLAIGGVSVTMVTINNSMEDRAIETNLENILQKITETIHDLIVEGENQIQLGGSDIEMVISLTLPESIYTLNSLEWFVVSNSRLSSLSDLLGELKNVSELAFDRNKLTDLPESIGDMENLKWLHLSKNKLEYLPDSIGRLNNLELLDISSNKIYYLPESIEKLKSLKELNIKRNKINSNDEIILLLENQGIKINILGFNFLLEEFKSDKLYTKIITNIKIFRKVISNIFWLVR